MAGLDSLYNRQDTPAKEEDVTLFINPDTLTYHTKNEYDDEEYMERLLGLPREAFLGRLAERFSDMDSARLDDLWNECLRQYYSPFVVRRDGKANTNLSIEQATIRNKQADIEAQPTIIKYVATEQSDIYKKDFVSETAAYVGKENNTDKEKTKLIHGTLIFGSGWWFEGVWTDRYTRYEPKLQKDGKIQSIPKTMVRSWLGGKALDIRDVWIDPVSDIEDAIDCFVQEKDHTYESIKGLLEDPNYDKNEVQCFLDTLGDGQQGQDPTYRPFFTRNDATDARKQKYILYHYYNKEKGIYIVTDQSFKFLLRYGANPYPHGQLPVSICIDHQRYQEMWGIGECELLRNTKYERNVVRNQIIDYARESNTINFAVGENVTFKNDELVAGVGRVWNFSGSLGDSQFIKPPSQDNSLFSIDSMLQSDATWITGIDNNALAGNQSKTAFEARLQEQNKLKGIYVFLRNFDYFFTRVMRQRLANIQFFMPITTGRNIIGEKKAKKYRMIPVEGMELDGMHSMVNEKGEVEEVAPKLSKMEGKTAFLEMNPKYLQNSLDVTVETPTTTPILRELNNQEMDKFVQFLPALMQFPQAQQQLQDINFSKIVDWRLEASGLDPTDFRDETSPQDEQQDSLGAFMAQVGKPFQPQNPLPKEAAQSLQGAVEMGNLSQAPNLG